MSLLRPGVIKQHQTKPNPIPDVGHSSYVADAAVSQLLGLADGARDVLEAVNAVSTLSTLCVVNNAAVPHLLKIPGSLNIIGE